MELHLAADSPPLAAIAAAKIASLPLTPTPTLASVSPPSLLLSNGEKLHEDCVLLKYIGRIAANLPNFYGGDAYQSCKIDEWIDYAPVFSWESEFDGACSLVDAHLLHSRFIVGASLTIADVAVWARLAGAGLRWESLRKSKKYQNLVRWFNSILSEHDAALNDFVATYTGNKSSSTKAVSSKSKESQASNARSAATEKGSHMVEKAGSRPRFEDLLGQMGLLSPDVSKQIAVRDSLLYWMSVMPEVTYKQIQKTLHAQAQVVLKQSKKANNSAGGSYIYMHVSLLCVFILLVMFPGQVKMKKAQHSLGKAKQDLSLMLKALREMAPTATYLWLSLSILFFTHQL